MVGALRGAAADELDELDDADEVAPAPQEVIDRDELDQAPQRMADEVLRALPSVTTYRRDSSLVVDPASQGLGLRGLAPAPVARALVLRDGVPVLEPFAGRMYWRSVRLLALERIEVQPGGGSARHGSGALGGVVQLVSRPIEPRTGEVLLASGTEDTERAAGRISDRFGDVGLALDAEGLHSDGSKPHLFGGAIDGPAPSWHLAGGLRVEHRRGGSLVRVTADYLREHLDAGTQHETSDLRVYGYGAGWRLARGGAGTLTVELFGGHEDLRRTTGLHVPSRGSSMLASTERALVNHQGGALAWSSIAGRHAWTAGVDARRVGASSADQRTAYARGPDGAYRREVDGQQVIAGVFAEDVVRLGAVEVSLGLRLDAWRDLDGRLAIADPNPDATVAEYPARSDVELDPRVGARWRISDVLTVDVAAYRAFRAPTLDELYRPFQAGYTLTDANAALRPETLWGAEAGATIAARGVVGRATVFYQRLDDPITIVTLVEPTASNAWQQRQNLGANRAAGVELALDWRPHRDWRVGVGHTFVDAIVLAAPGFPERVGKRVPLDARDRTSVSVTFERPSLGTAVLQLHRRGRMFEDHLEQATLGPVTLVDAHVERRLGGGVSVFASGQNVLDVRYRTGRTEEGETYGAPRSLELGVVYR